MRQRVREFEAALEEDRQAIARDTQRRLADIERAAIEELETIESAAADKTAEIHWVTAEQREAVEALTRGMVSKILHGPITELKDGAGRPGHGALVQLIRKIFGLGG